LLKVLRLRRQNLAKQIHVEVRPQLVGTWGDEGFLSLECDELVNNREFYEIEQVAPTFDELVERLSTGEREVAGERRDVAYGSARVTHSTVKRIPSTA
jgi:hypothetical protein